MADTVDSDTARRHMERIPVVRETEDSASAATELTRDVRPRRVVDVGATERRRREVAACSSIISTSRAYETRGPAGTRRQTIEAPTTNGRASADESSKRRWLNCLVSHARRHTNQLRVPSTIVSEGRRLCSDPPQRRRDDGASCGWTLRTRRRSDERPRSSYSSE